MNVAALRRPAYAAPAETEAQSLPAWIYRDAEFFERERQAIFRHSWQVVCHVSDVPRPGDCYVAGPLSSGEVCLRSFARRMRALIPESALPQPPPRGWSHG